MSFPSEGRGHKFESCRARQRIIGLAGSAVDRAAPSYPVATKFEKKDSSDRFMCVPPGSEEQQLSKLKVAGSNPAGVATRLKNARRWLISSLLGKRGFRCWVNPFRSVPCGLLIWQTFVRARMS
jgi:hypothetical protein